MHYLDLTFTVRPADLHHFQSALFDALHANHTRYGVAIAFPHWQDGEPNKTDSFSNFARHAKAGPVMRLFANDAAVLEKLSLDLQFKDLQAQAIASASPIRKAPQGCQGIAYVRARNKERAIKLDRIKDPADPRKLRDPLEVRQAREVAVRDTLHQQLYFKVSSKSSQQGFSLFIERLKSNEASDSLMLNSYGLSNKPQPCFLPDF